MMYTTEMIEEMNVLALFDVSNHQEGIKVHKTAEDNTVEATGRLYAKGLVTQKDGGYLTELGLDAAERALSLLTILTTP